jgi:hypothetical protein
MHKNSVWLKGQSREFFDPRFFHQSIPLWSLIIKIIRDAPDIRPDNPPFFISGLWPVTTEFDLSHIRRIPATGHSRISANWKV